MANDINQVALTGRLVKGAEVKYPRENFCVVTFTIASNENQKKKVISGKKEQIILTAHFPATMQKLWLHQ